MYHSRKSNSELCASQHVSSRWRFALIFAGVITTIIIAAPNGVAQQLVRPLKVRALRSPGGRVSFVEYSGFSTTGRIFELSQSSIGVMTDKACWAPYGRGQAALWPPGMVLSASVAAVGVPVTVDGKKAGLGQLAVGQSVNVTYSIYSGGYCAARRINASSSPAGKR